MSETEDQLRHTLGNVEAKVGGLERLLDDAARHIRKLAQDAPEGSTRSEALSFARRVERAMALAANAGEVRHAPEEDDLVGMRVLVLEDEIYPGMSVQTTLLSAGAEQVRLVNGIAAGRAVVDDFKPHVAVLDLDLHGKDARPLAHELAERGLPFVFHTGTVSSDDLQAEFPNHTILRKPADPKRLVDVLKKLTLGE